MPHLGVNIDHVATVRQARQTIEPDPVWAAMLAELGGADGITLHLREDRRHIQDRDLRVMLETVQVKVNLEIAIAESVVAIAMESKPHQISLVPEKREEVTTEGGLDVLGNKPRITEVVGRAKEAGIEPNLFIDPDLSQIEAALAVGANAVELHTGRYADAETPEQVDNEFDTLLESAQYAQQKGLKVHMGHGLTYRNVRRIAEINGIQELNIGHSIVARAVMVGFEKAVTEMKQLVTI
jgi:pyridoxine 5-phosphate synthase